MYFLQITGISQLKHPKNDRDVSQCTCPRGSPDAGIAPSCPAAHKSPRIREFGFPNAGIDAVFILSFYSQPWLPIHWQAQVARER